MATFRVWDELNGSRETAHNIEARDAETAAVVFAEGDYDGQSDGLYQRGTQPIMVEDADGHVTRCGVYAEWEPVFFVASTEKVP